MGTDLGDHLLGEPLLDRAPFPAGHADLAARGLRDREADELGHAGAEVVVEAELPVHVVVTTEVVGRVGHEPDEVAQATARRRVPLRPQVIG